MRDGAAAVSPPGRAFAVAAGLLLLGAGGLACVERSPWPLLLAPLPWLVWRLARGRPDRALGVAAPAGATLAAVAALDAALALLGRPTLGELARRFAAHALAPNPGESQVVRGGCPRFRPRAQGGRDARGVRWQRVGDGARRVLVVGDSLMTVGAADALRDAFRGAGLGAHVGDTSSGGYDQVDEACIVREQLAEARPALAVVGVCLNDFAHEELRLDLGGGAATYAWGAVYDWRLRAAGTLPLLLESGTRWVEAHRADVVGEFGRRAVFDFDRAGAFGAALDRGYRDANLRALAGTARALRAAGVPAAFVLFPLNYPAARDPTGALREAAADALREAGAAFVDLRPVFAQFRSDELRFTSLSEPVPRGEWEPLDVTHFDRPVVRLGLHEALGALAAQGGGPEIAAVRAALAETVPPPFARALGSATAGAPR